MFLLNQIIVSPFVHIFYITGISLFATEFEEPIYFVIGKCFQFDPVKHF